MKKIILLVLFSIPFLLLAQEKQGKDTAQPIKINARIAAELQKLQHTEEIKDKAAMAHCLANLGKMYLEMAKQSQQNEDGSSDRKLNLDKSIEFSKKGVLVNGEVGDKTGLKECYVNLYAAQKLSGDIMGAIESYRKMISLQHTILAPKKAKEIEQKQMIYKYGKREDSILGTKKIAEERLKKQTITLTEKLDKSNETLLITEKEKALEEMRQQLKQDSLELKQGILQNELQRQQNENWKKEEERIKERNFYILGLVVLLTVSLMAFRIIRIQKKFNLALVREKKRSENLLLNILPAEVAEELMEKGYADAKHFENVTVLFTDFVSFTSIAATMTPHQLVSELDVCFKAFDNILGRYRIEKIKTIGDAYMAVSGLPVENPNHALHIIEAAKEIRDFMHHRRKEMGSNTFDVRIGINSGDVIAGIVGSRKFSYDIWGDTVNVAARMEHHGGAGKINISKATYLLVQDKYKWEYRGKLEAKNMGSIDMYYLV